MGPGAGDPGRSGCLAIRIDLRTGTLLESAFILGGETLLAKVTPLVVAAGWRVAGIATMAPEPSRMLNSPSHVICQAKPARGCRFSIPAQPDHFQVLCRLPEPSYAYPSNGSWDKQIFRCYVWNIAVAPESQAQS